ncbi:MAG: GNAT family N-acetyltransferase [Rhizobiaceae bacterium]
MLRVDDNVPLPFIVLDAQVGDAEAIAKIHVQCWHEAYSGIIPQSYLDSLNTTERKARWLKVISSGEIVLVATVDEQIVGFVGGLAMRGPYTQAIGEITSLYVLSKHHRTGIGKALFSACKTRLKENRLFPFALWVVEGNDPAIKFYETMGGKNVATKSFELAGKKLDEHLYLYD